MSAFLVSTDHIDFLVSACIAACVEFNSARGNRIAITRDTAFKTARLLISANALSVVDSLESPDNKATAERDGSEMLKEYNFILFPVAYRFEPSQVLESLACYRYQASDWMHWTGSDAQRICDALRDAIIRKIAASATSKWSAPINDARVAKPVASNPVAAMLAAIPSAPIDDNANGNAPAPAPIDKSNASIVVPVGCTQAESDAIRARIANGAQVLLSSIVNLKPASKPASKPATALQNATQARMSRAAVAAMPVPAKPVVKPAPTKAMRGLGGQKPGKPGRKQIGF